jgi:hypothetical protein
MLAWFRSLDRLLRGEATDARQLERGDIDIPLPGLTVLIVLLGATYGACMGTFALMRTAGPVYEQVGASMMKVPLLFLLTLLITFPSLYVFNALVGSRLTFHSVLRLLIASTSVTLAVLASFGPIVAFFSVSTTSYPFMVLLNVVMFAVAGFLGIGFLLQTLHRLSLIDEAIRRRPIEPVFVDVPTDDATASPEPTRPEPPTLELSPLEMPRGQILGAHVRTVFRCWMVVFGLVGAQMSWVLRPFIGNPDEPFTMFRGRQSNFFEALWHTVINLF